MKNLILSTVMALIFFVGLNTSTVHSQNLKVCIYTAYNEKLSLTIQDYFSAGNVKNVVGVEDATAYGCNIWPETGTYTKSTRTFNLTGYNPGPQTNCIGCANVHSLTFIATTPLHMDHTFTNDCGAGAYSALIFVGCDCNTQLIDGPFADLSSGKDAQANSGIINSSKSRDSDPLSPGGTDIGLFPNPATGKISVEYIGKITGDVQFSIFNSMGVEVFSRTEETIEGFGSTFQFELDNFAPGIYILTAKNGDEVSQKKFVIEK